MSNILFQIEVQHFCFFRNGLVIADLSEWCLILLPLLVRQLQVKLFSFLCMLVMFSYDSCWLSNIAHVIALTNTVFNGIYYGIVNYVMMVLFCLHDQLSSWKILPFLAAKNVFIHFFVWLYASLNSSIPSAVHACDQLFIS